MIARVLAVALGALILIVPGASAQDPGQVPTREEYVADSEPICRTHYRDTFRLLDKAGDWAGAGRLERAGKIMIRAFRTAVEANKELRKLEKPPLDAETLAAWLESNRRAFNLGIEAGKVLKAEHGARAKRLQSRASRKARKANEKVAGFGFRHCV